jgi:hypothetical protein
MSKGKRIFLLTIYFSCVLSSCNTSISQAKLPFNHDKSLLIHKANEFLMSDPITISSFTATRSEGGRNDYFSEGPYWWPDPLNPDGPYIRRDGYRNPQNFNQHHNAITRFVEQVSILTAAYVITKDKNYALTAQKHLVAWFINSETKMNPNFLYSQAIKGLYSGRGIGIIDGINFIHVANAVTILEKDKLLVGENLEAIKNWYGSMANWLVTHQYGKDEKANNNNHSTWWGAQVASYARLSGDKELVKVATEQFKEQLSIQMNANGGFPDELGRTKPFHYTNYNIEAWATLATIIQSKSFDPWKYKSKNGTLLDAINFTFKYTKNPSSWSYFTELEPFIKPSSEFYWVLIYNGTKDLKFREVWNEYYKENHLQQAHVVMWTKVENI